MAQFCPQVLGFIFVTSYDLRVYSGSMRTQLQTGLTKLEWLVIYEFYT
jgi:hypothetical protein